MPLFIEQENILRSVYRHCEWFGTDEGSSIVFGTGTIDGDEEGGALGKENGNVVVEDEEDGEDELGTWNFELGTWNLELCARLSCVPSVASATLWDVERPLSQRR